MVYNQLKYKILKLMVFFFLINFFIPSYYHFELKTRFTLIKKIKIIIYQNTDVYIKNNYNNLEIFLKPCIYHLNNRINVKIFF